MKERRTQKRIFPFPWARVNFCVSFILNLFLLSPYFPDPAGRYGDYVDSPEASLLPTRIVTAPAFTCIFRLVGLEKSPSFTYTKRVFTLTDKNKKRSNERQKNKISGRPACRDHRRLRTPAFLNRFEVRGKQIRNLETGKGDVGRNLGGDRVRSERPLLLLLLLHNVICALTRCLGSHFKYGTGVSKGK